MKSIQREMLRLQFQVRGRLVGNIVLTGGNSLLPGLDKRLEAELTSMLPDNIGKKVSVRVNAQKGRENFTWKGGAHLCSLSSFQGLWLTKQDYQETGATINVQEGTVFEQK